MNFTFLWSHEFLFVSLRCLFTMHSNKCTEWIFFPIFVFQWISIQTMIRLFFGIHTLCPFFLFQLSFFLRFTLSEWNFQKIHTLTNNQLNEFKRKNAHCNQHSSLATTKTTTSKKKSRTILKTSQNFDHFPLCYCISPGWMNSYSVVTCHILYLFKEHSSISVHSFSISSQGSTLVVHGQKCGNGKPL